MKTKIKQSFLNLAIFVVILFLLAIGALIPYLIADPLRYSSDTIMILSTTQSLNQNEFYFLLCVIIALFLSILLLMVGLISKINKKKTYKAIVFGLLGLL